MACPVPKRSFWCGVQIQPRASIRRDARADEWGGLENHYTRKGIGGSNPPPAVAPMFNFFKKKKAEPKNLKEILAQFKELEKSFEGVAKKLEDLQKESRFFVQKVGIVRFNPFSEVGGDQSFSIALLDGQDSGLVITSLYTREGNRVYGKPIKKSESKYLLSDEEKQAIAQANEVSAGREMKTKLSANNGNKNSKLGSKAAHSGGYGTH